MEPEKQANQEAATESKPAAPTGAEEQTGMVAGESLEQGGNDTASAEGLGESPAPPATEPTPPPKKGISSKFRGLNIYLMLFIFVILIAVMALFIGIQRSKKEATPTEITSQTLTPDTINQLKGNDIKIGDVKQTLSVESNAIFAGRILVQGGADVAGALKVAGTLSASSVAAGGTSTFEKLQANDLAVSGNVGVSGQFTVQKTLNVSGNGTFGGSLSAPQLTVDTLQLSNDLQLNGHIDAGGSTPTRSNGSALGTGGTASNSGTDTAGTVTISTGGAPAAGCFVTLTFVKKFNSVPHVALTPSSSDASNLDYYVNRTTANFSICATNPAASKNYAFDYIVID